MDNIKIGTQKVISFISHCVFAGYTCTPRYTGHGGAAVVAKAACLYSEVGDRGLVPSSGIQVSKKQMFFSVQALSHEDSVLWTASVTER